jgi:hypothetical protein
LIKKIIFLVLIPIVLFSQSMLLVTGGSYEKHILKFPESVNQTSTSYADWLYLNYISAEDGNNASCDLYPDDFTETIISTNYNFLLPSDATILGIVVQIKCRSEYFENGTSRFLNVQLCKSSSGVGSNYAGDIAITKGGAIWYVFGGNNDLWGTTWTYSEINDSATGVLVSVWPDYIDDNRLIYVDCIRMIVYYID